MMARLGNGHVNIVRPIEVVLTGRHVAFVNEFVQGGSVSDFLKKSKMDEDLACYLFRQLLEAIAYCHEHKVGQRASWRTAWAILRRRNIAHMHLACSAAREGADSDKIRPQRLEGWICNLGIPFFDPSSPNRRPYPSACFVPRARWPIVTSSRPTAC
jgi:hypothetical protein